MLLVVCALLAEAASRVIHRRGAPLLPYAFAQHAALLPPRLDMRASFNWLPPNRYMTDAHSARIGNPGIAGQPPYGGVFAIGDSQMLGYMLDFHDTFASLVARRICGSADNARLLAAPADHPGSYEAMLEQYSRFGVLKPRLLIIGLNLGNDLDELYSEGLSDSSSDTSALQFWLLRHSYAYMDWVLIDNHVLRSPPTPPGVNPIVYMLTPDERIELARQAVDELDRIARSPHIAAQKTMIVITPADYQVDPREFEKYRQFYPTDGGYVKWERNVPAFAAMMNTIETFIANELTRRGYTVVRLSRVVAERPHAQRVFDSWSHHLTAYGHRLLANAVIDSEPH
jgi:hypothetical protein